LFGILAPIGLGYFAYSEIRARRQEKLQAPPACGGQAPAAASPSTVEEKLADRYGRRR
jgi:hypothetical protein